MKKIIKIVLALMLLSSSFTFTSAYKYEQINNSLGKYYNKLDNKILDTQKKIDVLEKIKNKIDYLFKVKWNKLSRDNKQLLMLIKSSLINKIRFYEKELEEIDISELFWDIEESKNIFYEDGILKWTWIKKWYYTAISLERDVVDNSSAYSKYDLILVKNEVNFRKIFENSFISNWKYKISINTYKKERTSWGGWKPVDSFSWYINIKNLNTYSQIWYKIIWNDLLLDWVKWNKNIVFSYEMVGEWWYIDSADIFNRRQIFKDTVLIKWWATILKNKFKSKRFWYLIIHWTNSEKFSRGEVSMKKIYINSYWRFYTRDLLENIKKEENNVSVNNCSYNWINTINWEKVLYVKNFTYGNWKKFFEITYKCDNWKLYETVRRYLYLKCNKWFTEDNSRGVCIKDITKIKNINIKYDWKNTLTWDSVYWAKIYDIKIGNNFYYTKWKTFFEIKKLEWNLNVSIEAYDNNWWNILWTWKKYIYIKSNNKWCVDFIWNTRKDWEKFSFNRSFPIANWGESVYVTYKCNNWVINEIKRVLRATRCNQLYIEHIKWKCISVSSIREANKWKECIKDWKVIKHWDNIKYNETFPYWTWKKVYSIEAECNNWYLNQTTRRLDLFTCNNWYYNNNWECIEDEKKYEFDKRYCDVNIDWVIYSLNNCKLVYSMKDWEWDKSFSFWIKSNISTTEHISFSVYWYWEWFPTYWILSEISSWWIKKWNIELKDKFTDKHLTKELYKGYLKIKLRDNSWKYHEIRQYIDLKIR